MHLAVLSILLIPIKAYEKSLRVFLKIYQARQCHPEFRDVEVRQRYRVSLWVERDGGEILCVIGV